VRRLSSASFYRSATHVSECTVDTRMYAFSLHSYCVCVCGRVVAVRGLCGLAVFALWSYSCGASSLSLGGASWSSVWGFVVCARGLAVCARGFVVVSARGLVICVRCLVVVCGRGLCGTRVRRRRRGPCACVVVVADCVPASSFAQGLGAQVVVAGAVCPSSSRGTLHVVIVAQRVWARVARRPCVLV